MGYGRWSTEYLSLNFIIKGFSLEEWI